MNAPSSRRPSVPATAASLVLLAAAIAVLFSQRAPRHQPQAPPPSTEAPAPTQYAEPPTRLSAPTPQADAETPPPTTTTTPPLVIEPEHELDVQREDDHHPAPTHRDAVPREDQSGGHTGNNNHREWGDGRTGIWRWLT